MQMLEPVGSFGQQTLGESWNTAYHLKTDRE